jgi:hypothetical protein
LRNERRIQSLGLAAAGLSQPQIARALKLSLCAVNKYLQAARTAGVGWPLPDALSDRQLRERLFPNKHRAILLAKVAPDFALVHQELKRKGVTQYSELSVKRLKPKYFLSKAHRNRATFRPLVRSGDAIESVDRTVEGDHL